MKKIGLLMSLASVIVVGGVYATWSYSQGSVASATDDYSVVMTAETIKGEKGTFNVSSSTVTFEIGNKGEYHPELRGSGDVFVTFTPSVGADTAVREQGIDIKWSIDICEDGQGNWKYDKDFDGDVDTDFFTITQTEAVIVAKATADSTSQPGRFVYTIPVSEIMNYIHLNVADDFVLDTKAKYDSFASFLNDHKFVLTISEA